MKPLAADPTTERSERVVEEAEDNGTDMKHLRAVINIDKSEQKPES